MAPPWGLLGQVVSSEPTVAERDKVYEAAATAGGDPMRASNFGLSRLELGARQQARADELDHTVPVVLIRWVSWRSPSCACNGNWDSHYFRRAILVSRCAPGARPSCRNKAAMYTSLSLGLSYMIT